MASKSPFAQITLSTVIHNLEQRLNIYYRCHGRHVSPWYYAKHEVCREIADFTGFRLAQIAGVIAVTSPLKSWVRNLENATHLIYKHIDGIDISTTKTPQGCFTRDKVKAQRILNGEPVENVISGAKVSAFWHNLVWPYESTSVTIDSRLIHAAWGGHVSQANIGKATYHLRDLTEEAIRHLALRYGSLPHEIQAAVWEAKDIEKELESQ